MAEPISAIFLDRDGTIIEDAHYARDPEKVVFIPGAMDALLELRKKGFSLFVVSNQAGVGRGIITDQQFKDVHARFAKELEAKNVKIDAYFYCFHHPDDPCHCRKPKTGMVPKSFEGRPIDFSKSYVVGDRDSDLELGRRLGSKPVLVLTGKGQKTAEELEAAKVNGFIKAADLLDFSRKI